MTWQILSIIPYSNGDAAIEPIEGLATSSSLRAGLSAWIKMMAKAYGPFGIRINGVLPGYIDTDLLKTSAEKTAQKSNVSSQNIYAEWQAPIPLQRFGAPRDIAHAALFLASDAASYISGTTLLVDGGLAKAL